MYGEARTSERYKTWDLLKFIKSWSPLPWVCISDFNEVLDGSEHVGVQERSNAQMEGFREAIDVCGLADLGFEGRKWTYEKKVTGFVWIERWPLLIGSCVILLPRFSTL